MKKHFLNLITIFFVILGTNAHCMRTKEEKTCTEILKKRKEALIYEIEKEEQKKVRFERDLQDFNGILKKEKRRVKWIKTKEGCFYCFGATGVACSFCILYYIFSIINN